MIIFHKNHQVLILPSPAIYSSVLCCLHFGNTKSGVLLKTLLKSNDQLQVRDTCKILKVESHFSLKRLNHLRYYNNRARYGFGHDMPLWKKGNATIKQPLYMMDLVRRFCAD